jgi:chromosomal replication initiation ATPase DnaA
VLVKYIHLNPVRAKVVTSPEEYLWSSHGHYIGKDNSNIIDTDQILRLFSEQKVKARRFYEAFIADRIPIRKEDIYEAVDQRMLGSEKFIEQVVERTEEGIEQRKKRHEFTLEEIAEGIENVYGITCGQLRDKSKDRNKVQGRMLMSIVAKEYGYMGREIAKYLRKDPAVISRYVRSRDNFKQELKKVFQALQGKKSNKQV